METTPGQKPRRLPLQRALVTLLSWLRRLLGSIYLDAIERELAGLRKLIESRELSSTEDAEEVTTHSPDS
jgi:hypothetical protein